MSKDQKRTKKEEQLETQVAELTADLQRLRADFENYLKRVESEKDSVRQLASAAVIMKLLPIIDTIERAAGHIPDELVDNAWVKGVAGLGKNLEKMLDDLQLTRIIATPGTPFDPHLHEAVMMLDGEGDHEVVAEELRAGFVLAGQAIRPAMVKVGKQ